MTLRSRPWKEHDTVRLRIIAERLQYAHGERQRPRRIARWSKCGRRWRVLTGHASEHQRAGRRWRMVLRIKRRVATWYRRREL
jgi:hypothetical protein